jgi:8-oxo-dGTP diphosphatase
MELVAAAIIRDGNRVLLARRSARLRLPGRWEFPGGKVEEWETPEQCLVRELHEELGIEINVHQQLTESTYTYEHGTFKILAFLVEWVSGEIATLVHDRVEWVKITDLNHFELLAGDLPIAAALASTTTRNAEASAR